MNAVIIGVMLMLTLSLLRINVIVAMTLSALTAGLISGMSLVDTLNAFNSGLSGGAEIALSYAMLGAFAVAISKSGLTQILAEKLLANVDRHDNADEKRSLSYVILTVILLCSIASQNIIPVHIAFIPILIPPILVILNKLALDRRAIACVLTFGLATSYMVLPYGFGGIYLYSILHKNLADNGLEIVNTAVPQAMIIPAIGMVVGLLIALLFTYRHKRYYKQSLITEPTQKKVENKQKVLFVGFMAIGLSLIAQNLSGSMILGGLTGVVVFTLFGAVKWHESNDLFSKGVSMMALIGFIMISAQGFSEVIKQTGDVASLVDGAVAIIGDNKPLAAALILLVGLLITMGIGSSFSTVPIIATLFVPLCIELNFSVMATAALVGTAGALGDAGSPASDSTLGPTSGLNADGQHDHIWDSVVPTFTHFNIPLLVFGWIAAMVL
ncbi:Na+/H+ antiporter family protein [Pseudoalteromonas ulvae]|uniref:Sodium:proton antiporter n=1 Tax=Pseudoalteromonas ulvae TaxID=107327 RepID=A0A244CNJ6_PSEDV|nr:Na+/H+ antiporter family protein [Pseudoalteromonas ulvae]OUL56779.1 sodium:proton antiporter [Pseudoalteromonas ulvae]